jgi:hypothetical protein
VGRQSKNTYAIVISMAFATLVGSLALAAQDKYTLTIPWSDFRGYDYACHTTVAAMDYIFTAYPKDQ